MFCRSIEIENNFDLNNVCRSDGMLFVRNGSGHSARGIVATVPESQIRAVLSEMVDVNNGPNSVIAFGLIPFSPTATASFFIPQVLFTKDSTGRCTATIVGKTAAEVSESALDSAVFEAMHALPPRPSSNTFSVHPRTDVEHYLQTVSLARDAVSRGELEKVVIARDIEVVAREPIDVHSVLHRLRASFGMSYRFCVGSLVGASPELLVQVEGHTVKSHPLAGTAPRTGDQDTDTRLANELIASTKNQIEHRVVIDMVRDTLLPYCSYLDWESKPSIVTVANVQHLGTAIEGALTEPRAHVLDLVRKLCPTPALGGHPTKEALAFIAQHEQMERNFYGGAVGVLNASGEGTFAVTIRCAELNEDRTTARLFAGGGIVAESDPYAELAETQAKFQAMLSAIIRP